MIAFLELLFNTVLKFGLLCLAFDVLKTVREIVVAYLNNFEE